MSITLTFNRHNFSFMKKIAVLFLGLALSVASFGISTAHAAGSATLTLSPTNTTVETGDSFTLSVLVDPNGESLDTVRLELNYDADMLEVTAFDLGSMFPYQSPSNEIDNTNGMLSQGAFKFGDPVESSGTFATITFHALSAGSASISVDSDSRLIEDGDEKIDAGALGSASITISGDDVDAEAEEVTTDAEEEEEATEETTSGSTGTGTSASLEEQALVYFGAFYASMPSSEDDWAALHCIAYGGCKGDPQDLAAEQAALVIFGEKYGTMPSTDMEWNVVHTLAYTDFLDNGTEEAADEMPEEEEMEEEMTEEVVEEEVSYVDESLSLEQQALVYFGAFYARMPSSGDDWAALHCIAYGGCQGDPRDVQAEEDALVLFGQKYAKMPSTDMEWNVLHTIAYTDLLTYDQQGSEETEEEVVEVVEEEVVEETEEVVEEEAVEEVEEEVTEEADEELSLQEQAIGWFGQLTGELPSSDEDWLAVDYMVHGHTPETQNLEAEAAAIDLYVGAFGSLPSSDQDWNIVSAIAYSGAFDL